jgi:hypothetical protein
MPEWQTLGLVRILEISIGVTAGKNHTAMANHEILLWTVLRLNFYSSTSIQVIHTHFLCRRQYAEV